MSFFTTLGTTNKIPFPKIAFGVVAELKGKYHKKSTHNTNGKIKLNLTYPTPPGHPQAGLLSLFFFFALLHHIASVNIYTCGIAV